MITMRVISLWQPWATLLVTGLKTIETRSWSTKTDDRICIHASVKRSREQIEFFEALFPALNPKGYSKFDDLPRGGIIGSVRLEHCLPVDSPEVKKLLRSNPDEWLYGNYAPGRFAWITEFPVQYDHVIPETGRQGFWRVPIDRIPETPDVEI